MVLATKFDTLKWGDLVVGASTLAVLVLWSKLKIKFPAHLPAVLVGTAVAWVLTTYCDQTIATIGSRFHYTNPDGTVGNGIPPFMPASFPVRLRSRLLQPLSAVLCSTGLRQGIQVLRAYEPCVPTMGEACVPMHDRFPEYHDRPDS